MDFVVGDVVRQGFGFANPNHAAAAICALFPFCWGWRGGWRWVGLVSSIVLFIMLVMTYSRTGVVVFAVEATLFGWIMSGESRRAHSVRLPIWGFILTVCLVSVAVWWMWPRMTIDGAIVNRPKIWLAGLQLFAANPMGVGFGSSGEIASAIMLPDGITVRTLVNSHLTLLAEMGALVDSIWGQTPMRELKMSDKPTFSKHNIRSLGVCPHGLHGEATSRSPHRGTYGGRVFCSLISRKLIRHCVSEGMDKHSLCCLLRCAILVVMAFVAGCHTNSKSLVTSQERSYKTRFSDRETM